MSEANGSATVILPNHLADLRGSGLSDGQIRRCGFHSLQAPATIQRVLRWKRYEGELGDCLAFPFVDADGKSTGYCRLKPDRPRKARQDGKPIKYESPKGTSNHAFFPPGSLAAFKDAVQPLVITEGEKKAAKADQEGFPCIGLVGVYGWQKKRPRDSNGKGEGKRELIDGLASIPWQGRAVYLGFDSDAVDNSNVLWAEWHFAEALARQGADVRVVRIPPGAADANGKPVKMGLDDFLVAHGPAAFRRLLATATAPTRIRAATAGRPVITLSTEEHAVNDAAVEALAGDQSVYQRGGLLVRVSRDDSPAAAGVRRPLAPRIEVVPREILRERLTAVATWVSIRETKAGVQELPAHPPGWCVNAVHARGAWDGIRHLEAVVEYPVVRPDGTILQSPGYDPATALLLEPAGPLPGIPTTPYRADAMRARDRLLEVVTDFPFAGDIYRAAWLAGLLTPLARFEFNGPAPLFLVDGNVRGCGKGLLLDVIALIVTGERFTIATYTNDEDELRKRITSIVLGGDRLVLFDNLDGRFGNAVLDAALTGVSWRDRMLGVNRMVEAPMYMTWFATGNNVTIGADTARRICHVRLESSEERPENRRGFRHSDLRGFVREHRRELLAAALTILRAHAVAGRPGQELTPWGSFESWSAVVRAAVVWLGLPDPGETRIVLQDQSDVSASAMTTLLNCLEHIDPDRRGLTAAQLVDHAKGDGEGELRDAVESLAGKLDTRTLGNKLRTYRRRIFEGRYLDRAGEAQRAAKWASFKAEEFSAGLKKTHHTHHTHGPESESGESCESFSANEELSPAQCGPYAERF